MSMFKKRSSDAAVVLENVRGATVENVTITGGKINQALVSIAGNGIVTGVCKKCGFSETVSGQDMDITEIRCPKCGSTDVRISASSS